MLMICWSKKNTLFVSRKQSQLFLFKMANSIICLDSLQRTHIHIIGFHFLKIQGQITNTPCILMHIILLVLFLQPIIKLHNITQVITS